jgi:DNA adenine methylase
VKVLKAPFPWFGGKSRAAELIWSRLGDVSNYVEPFFGSGAVLLGRPHPPQIETINDLDGFVANFWRAVQAAPDEVALHANQQVSEVDLHARHVRLVSVRDDLSLRLAGDIDYYDTKIAGWWVWGACAWIGSGWCSGRGPWWPDGEGRLVRVANAGRGVKRQLPHLSHAGRGVNRKLNPGTERGEWVRAWMRDLRERLANTRVCCGDWSRVVTSAVTRAPASGQVGVVLDPPYAVASGRTSDVYALDSADVSHAVREWAVEAGRNPRLRIALCGYEGEHVLPPEWECVAWSAHGGYASGSGSANAENCKRERIWFSPACLRGAS